MNISLPFLCPIFDPLEIEFFVHDITNKITCARENLKAMMCAKQFPCFDIISIHNYNSFSGIGAIPPRQAIAF